MMTTNRITRAPLDRTSIAQPLDVLLAAECGDAPGVVASWLENPASVPSDVRVRLARARRDIETRRSAS